MTTLENRKTLDTWLRFLIQWEGGVKPGDDETTEHLFLRAPTRAFSDDPADRGGATMMGVTFQVFAFWRTKYLQRAAPSVEELRMIDYFEWEHIVESLYWEPLKAHVMPFECVAIALADWHWHSGSVATRTLQRTLGVAADGIVGRRTLGAIQAWCYNRVRARELADGLVSQRQRFLNRLMERHREQVRFAKGWEGRLRALHEMWAKLDLSNDEVELHRERQAAYINVR